MPVSTPPNKKRAWSWPAYLEEERAPAAPVKLFKEVQLFFTRFSVQHVCFSCILPVFFCYLISQHQSFPQSRNAFKVGMKLEGLDPSHPSLFCVLSVAEVKIPPRPFVAVVQIIHSFCACGEHLCFFFQIQGYRVRLHFDGYPECHDFWANADSWDMKPAGWCEKNGHKLLLPKGSPAVCYFNICICVQRKLWALKWFGKYWHLLTRLFLQAVKTENLIGACMWKTAGASWLQNTFSKA